MGPVFKLTDRVGVNVRAIVIERYGGPEVLQHRDDVAGCWTGGSPGLAPQ